MTHQEALAYLDSLEVLGIRPGLERVTRLLGLLGSPQATFPSILIAGTNGKGSVAACVGSILRQAGHAAGVYTSPHLVRFEERIVVGTEPIAPRVLADLTAELHDVIAGDRVLRNDPPTYFEATTSLAFLHFSRTRVPIAVLEVGMGGRFDATNVVTPLACAVTPIALDHTLWLGRTLGEIAAQKAGILKRGVPASISRQPTEALEVIRREARQVGAPLTLTTDCEILPLPRAGGATTTTRGAPSSGDAVDRPAHFPDPPVFSLVTPSGRRYDRLDLSLRGAHQVENAVTSVLLAEQLAASGVAGVDTATITAGLAGAVWPGRLELVPGRPDLLLDGAHNPAGCATLAAYLDEYQSGRPTILVFAAMRDKPAAEMLDILAPRAHKLILTRLPVSRGEDPEELQRLAAARHADAVPTSSVEEALRRAREAAAPGALVVVSGSLYLVGEVKRLLAG